jgi:hypothetical protein
MRWFGSKDAKIWLRDAKLWLREFRLFEAIFLNVGTKSF